MASTRKSLGAEGAGRVFVVWLVVTDVLMATMAFVAAYFLRRWLPFPEPAEGMPSFGAYLPMGAIHVASAVLVFTIARLYHFGRTSRLDELYGVIAGVTVATLMGVALASLSLREVEVGKEYSRVMVAYVWAVTAILVTVGRILNGLARQKATAAGWGRRRVLIVGVGDVARMILQKILWTPSLGYEAVGLVSMQPTDTDNVLGVPVVGTASRVGEIVDTLHADEVIIAVPDEVGHQDILWLIAECERGRVTIRVYPDLFQLMASNVSVSELGGIPILTVRDIAMTGWRRTAKRVMDIAGSMAGLVMLSPLMMLVAVIIKLESPGPAFYVQERMGLDGRPFPIIKFRSMRSDAEKRGPGWTTADDPRKTRVGDFLRRTNIDELPQFINVLLGDMSLVGPRPERPVYVEQFRRSIPRYMERHREKAGMTGWAQVNGYRQDTSIVERTKYDLWYVENWSLLLDIKIIIRTVLQMVKSPNAY